MADRWYVPFDGSAAPTPAPGVSRRARRFLNESFGELRKVVWPTRRSLRSHVVATLAAIAVVLAVSLIAAALALR